MALAERDPIPDGLSSRAAYKKIREWYVENVSKIRLRDDDYSQRSVLYIRSMPAARSASSEEMRDAFNQVLTGLLEWAYHESDGSYKMAAYATAGLAAIGGEMAREGDLKFFGMPATIWVALITAAAGLGAGYLGIRTGNKAVSDLNDVSRQVQDNQGQVRQLSATYAAAVAGSAGPLEKGQKLCRVLQGKAWRDGLIVPQNWTVSLCVDYMKKTGGSAYQLGCIYTDGTNLGGENGSFPSPNCGWQ